MSPLDLVLVAVAGGIGAGLRYALDRLLTAAPGAFPRGILIINVSGALVLGLLTGIGTAVIPAATLTIAGTGLLGGYTTFSTVCVETVLLAQRRRRRDALWNLFGTLGLSVAFAAAGIGAGAWLARLAG